jgi:hypothetical protein
VGSPYELYHSMTYNAAQVDADVTSLLGDSAVGTRKGVYEYVLGGKTDHKLLTIRIFDDKTKATKYPQQTEKANAKGISNCSLCTVRDNVNKTRIYQQGEMDADHVTAWSKGGVANLGNCERLRITHNRAKGNR